MIQMLARFAQLSSHQEWWFVIKIYKSSDSSNRNYLPKEVVDMWLLKAADRGRS